MDAISYTVAPTPGLVSIVIPTYRKDRYIGETLDSIGCQTYADWELIVVEDSSTGPTEQIVADFARRHPNNRVDYSRNDRNYGAAHSRNVAFTKCRGQFVALVDADDRWFPDHLAHAVANLNASDADLVYSSVLMIEDATEMLLGVCGPLAHDLAEFPESLYRRNFITPSATVLRREVLADVGPWNTAMKYCEDMDFWLRCLRAGKKFQLIGGCHCLYRKNHEGATTGRECGTVEELAEIVERFVPMPGLRESRLRRHVAKAYCRAAMCHAMADPARDTSADPSRCAMLMRKAWRHRPHRVDYLLESFKYAVAHRFRRQPPRPAPTNAAVAQTASRAAA
jgi:cellulose synthase/poly-beta-1,6-N-acetylglucosamine synthase-like glycosyltransferase